MVAYSLQGGATRSVIRRQRLFAELLSLKGSQNLKSDSGPVNTVEDGVKLTQTKGSQIKIFAHFLEAT